MTITINFTLEYFGHLENRGEYEVFIIDEKEDTQWENTQLF